VLHPKNYGTDLDVNNPISGIINKYSVITANTILKKMINE
jgi:hypothetical protein